MRQLFTMLLLALTMPALAQQTKSASDTIVVNKPQNVTVTRGADGTIAIAVEGREGSGAYRMKYQTEIAERDTAEWSLNLPFLKEAKQRSKWRWWCGGLYGGYAITNLDIAAPHLKKGLECGVTHLVGAKYNFGGSGFSFQTGLGLNVQALVSLNSAVRFDSEGGRLLTEPMPEGATKTSTTLSMFNMAVPLQFSKQFGKEFGVTAGLNLRWNTRNLAKVDYKVGGMNYAESVNGIKMRPLSYDIMASIGGKSTSIFVKYSPKSAFRTGFGPQYESWCIGLRFCNF